MKILYQLLMPLLILSPNYGMQLHPFGEKKDSIADNIARQQFLKAHNELNKNKKYIESHQLYNYQASITEWFEVTKKPFCTMANFIKISDVLGSMSLVAGTGLVLTSVERVLAGAENITDLNLALSYQLWHIGKWFLVSGLASKIPMKFLNTIQQKKQANAQLLLNRVNEMLSKQVIAPSDL